jgi:RNA polymerase sigma-70 factor (ECF subfamily)
MTLTAETRVGADEQDLIARMAAGDRRAFATFYELFAARVHGLVLRLIRNRAQAEEVSQEVFLLLWQESPQYSPIRGSVGAWVMTIAHRKTVDRIRSVQASHNRDLKQGIREYEDSYEDVEDTVATRLESDRVAIAMARLSEIQREAINLAYYRGLTYREIATELHIPAATVKTRVRDAMIRLRDELGVAA